MPFIKSDKEEILEEILCDAPVGRHRTHQRAIFTFLYGRGFVSDKEIISYLKMLKLAKKRGREKPDKFEARYKDSLRGYVKDINDTLSESVFQGKYLIARERRYGEVGYRFLKDREKVNRWLEKIEKKDKKKSEKASYRGMAPIDAGWFMMGSDDEKPGHMVYVDEFYIDKKEVTNEQFCKFLNEKGNQEEGGKNRLDIDNGLCQIKCVNDKYGPESGWENHPVVCVSWYGARAYAEWARKRLPTEAEWEKAARGKMEGKKYPWGDGNPSKMANYGAAEFVRSAETEPVGSFPYNGYGLYDMAGNVWEWCADWYRDDYYKNIPTINPKGPSSGKERVIRGGSWSETSEYLRCAVRHHFNPELSWCCLGFRCAKSV